MQSKHWIPNTHNMFRSKEIRWFSHNEMKFVEAWFEKNGYLFENTEARTDYYLPLREKEDLGIKLRENNIEIKHRKSRSEVVDLTSTVQGYYENYVKWSFSSAEGDILVHEITTEDKYDWLAVRKERIGFKLTDDEDGKIIRVSLDNFPDYGCQIEYTRVLVKDELWYTFALEWFGARELKFDTTIIKRILGEEQLMSEDSKGYAEFLNTI
ncbi:hypothetical protein [Christiangramia sabulilitoris]|uniref:CYTH domain-containing protein n=1 Tax=Christiangramia sabulilitoris TaxID=2583991 RepID=A0A550HWY2_9FLAO|nr:hypothetical protein [Christiangramia sabulilitoris]TRO63274.1 hypothetical protein FGM01_14105 [Christiangramia sabulilitoris]